ncbi:MAG: putative nucleic acid-binding Zn-ribbon protein [Neolewinella sp.]|jgi:predicted  nucleic acid-binding Zn-ribbon protein
MSKLAKAFDTVSQDDDRFANVLMKALEDKNLEGFDYLEFKQSVANMREIGMDDDTAIRAAFGTGSTVGLTLEKLVKTAKYYTEVLQDEKSKFMNSMEKHLMSNVEGKAKETGELKKKIANWEAKIEQMQVEVKKAKAKIESADELIDSAKEKASVNQQGFDDALDVITATIRADVADITRVLG